MKTYKRYSPEVREPAVLMVFEHQHEHESQWATIESIAGKIGCAAETLRGWVRQSVELPRFGGYLIFCVEGGIHDATFTPPLSS